MTRVERLSDAETADAARTNVVVINAQWGVSHAVTASPYVTTMKSPNCEACELNCTGKDDARPLAV
jgi:hypothetical protein